MGEGVQYAPRELLSVEDGLLKGILAGIRVPNLLDDGSLLGAISDVNLLVVSIRETVSMPTTRIELDKHGGTYIVLVNSSTRVLGDTKGVHRDLDLFAGVVETWARNVFCRDRILDQFVSITHAKMAKTITKSVDLVLALHDEEFQSKVK